MWYYFSRFIELMLKNKGLLGYTNLFFPKEYKKIKIILEYFQ